MKILVPIKRVPAMDAPIRVRMDGMGADTEGLAHVVNPLDAIALEEALRIREREESRAVEVVTISIGDESCEAELRTALAMGADRAIRVATEQAPDSSGVARVLAALVRRENPELVLMGKQATDDDANQAGQMLAGLLDWPQATFAIQIEFLDDQRLSVRRETDQGLETLRLSLPAVVTADLRLNEPRYASLPAIMRAKKKPIETLTLEELAVSIEPKVRVLRLEPAGVLRECVRVNSAAELVQRLRQEACVI